MKKESIFTKEGVFGCDVFILRFWKLRRSTLLRKIVFCGSGDTAFSQKKFDLLSGREKQVDFSSLSPKAGRCFQMAKGNILYNFSRCAEVVLRRFWSSILNPPDDFSQLSSLKTLLSRTEAASQILFPREGPGNRYCDQILTVGVAKMLERRRRSSSSGWDVVAAFLHPGIGWVSYPDGIV